MKGITLCAECAYYSMKTHKCTRGATGEPDLSKGDDVRFFTDCPLDNCVSVVRCKDCVYYHKEHIKRKDGTECDISEVPDEYKVFNMCNSDYGINVGGKCEYDNSYAPYEDDKTVFRQPDDYCSRGRRATMADLIEREPLLANMFPCAAKRQVEEAPAVNRWIPCSERMPEIDKDVLVYYPSWNDKPIQVAHLQYDGILFELSDGEYNFGSNAVTHWMPLPEPPEGGKQE